VIHPFLFLKLIEKEGIPEAHPIALEEKIAGACQLSPAGQRVGIAHLAQSIFVHPTGLEPGTQRSLFAKRGLADKHGMKTDAQGRLQR